MFGQETACTEDSNTTFPEYACAFSLTGKQSIGKSQLLTDCAT